MFGDRVAVAALGCAKAFQLQIALAHSNALEPMHRFHVVWISLQPLIEVLRKPVTGQVALFFTIHVKRISVHRRSSDVGVVELGLFLSTTVDHRNDDFTRRD